MAELTAEIVARFDQVNRELAKTAKGADNLEKEFKQAGNAALGLDKNLDKAAVSLQKVNRSAGKSSQIFFQAGQAVSDFAVAGVLGAANNIEFLALQLGASGPLIAGITALTVASLLFQDQLSKAFDDLFVDLDELQGKSKDVADSLIQINKDLKISFGGTLDELKDSSIIVDGIVENLQGRIKSLQSERRGGFALGGVTPGVSSQLAEDFSEIDDSILSIEKVLAKQLGIQESLNDKIEEETLLLEVIEELKKSGLKFTEEDIETGNKKKTQLEQAREVNTKLLAQLEALRNLDTSRLGQIIEQNRELREQIKVVQRLNDLRVNGALGIPGLERIGLGLSTGEGATPIGDLIGGINDRERQRKKNELALARTLDPDLLDEATEAQDRQTEAIARTTDRAEELSSVISGGLTDAISSFAEAIGSGEDPFTALRQSIGNFAIDMGRTVIGFAIAGDAIKTFIKSAPGVGIVAGAGLIALGSALKKSAQSKVDSFAGSASSSAVGQIPIADPRQGRDGRFRRDTAQFEPGFQPISSLANFSIPEFQFRLIGEDFVAGTDKNVQRQTRTRGTSPVRATGARSTSR